MIVAKGRVQAFIATLVMMLLLRGVTMVYTNGSPVNTGFTENGFTENADLFGWFGIGRPLGVPTPVWIMGIVFLAAWYMLHHTRLGRYITRVWGVTSTRWAATKRQRVFLVSTSIKSKSSSILFVVCWHRWPGSLKWRVSPPHNPLRGLAMSWMLLLRWFWAVRVWRAEKVALLGR